jgi:membrane fusion protein (multidrug efflux system)
LQSSAWKEEGMPEHPIVRDKPDDRPDAPELEERPSTPTVQRPDPKQSQRGERHEDAGRQGNRRSDEKRRSKLPLIILAVVILIAAIGGTYYWWTTRNEQTTDDAYTDGHAVSIAPQVAGVVQKLAITDNQFVHVGDLLVQIDPRDYQAARDQAEGALEVAKAQLANAQEAYSKAQIQFPAQLQAAEADVESAQASLTNAQAEYRRQQTINRAATTQQNVDQATAKLRQGEAQLRQAQAQLAQAQTVSQNIAQAAAQVKQWQGQVQQSEGELDRAKLNLSYTRVVAPQDGWITERRVEQGDYLQVGSAIMSIVSPQVWVTANYKETELDRMRSGQKATISVDAYPSLKLVGHVDSVQMGSGSKFSAFPAENATGNFVKIVQRVPVKIDIDQGLGNTYLPLGISVEVTVSLK